MSNKKPLIENKKQIADADNLLLPSMTIYDGSNSLDLTTVPLASHDSSHSVVNMTDTNGSPSDGQILKWDSTNSKFNYVNNSIIYGYIMAGYTGSVITDIEYINRSTKTQNATDAADLSTASSSWSGQTGNTKVYYAAGSTGTDIGKIEMLDPTTKTSNISNVGNMFQTRRIAGCVGGGDHDYIFWCGGIAGSTTVNTIEYISDTTESGNGSDKGNTTSAAHGLSGITGDTYGRVMNNIIYNYFDLSTTTGNASGAGTMAYALKYGGSFGNSDYGYYLGGQDSAPRNYIQYLDNTTGVSNMTDGGDVTISVFSCPGGISGKDYGFRVGGDTGSTTYTDVIDYIDMSLNTSNASDCGNLTQAKGWTGLSG